MNALLKIGFILLDIGFIAINVVVIALLLALPITVAIGLAH